ncbi:lipoprotein insertase outer membrane protein LolB [Thiotrichales bacterium 19S3-7]|nr:lipoprotein insertase outer membrane protein LolB [Thiotrichales bacterium 19S3-7]MCF6802467.1 lipoprotein insertase outer membrane protein LolB [Thiotrichales bacterium 19S3-11]
MVIRKLKSLGILLVTLTATFLAGCASNQATKLAPLPNLSTQNIQTAWKTNQAILQPIDSWEVSGVIGIRVKDKAQGANLFWRQTNKNQYIIQIYGTAGLGAISIKGRPDGSIVFKDSNGKETYAKNIQDLMQERLGWSVPVIDMYYWGRGLPAPIASKELSLNRFGLMSSLAQSGWQIQYDNFHMVQGRYPLPYKLVMKRGDLTVKVVIKSWLIN